MTGALIVAAGYALHIVRAFALAVFIRARA